MRYALRVVPLGDRWYGQVWVGRTLLTETRVFKRRETALRRAASEVAKAQRWARGERDYWAGMRAPGVLAGFRGPAPGDKWWVSRRVIVLA